MGVCWKACASELLIQMPFAQCVSAGHQRLVGGTEREMVCR